MTFTNPKDRMLIEASKSPSVFSSSKFSQAIDNYVKLKGEL